MHSLKSTIVWKSINNLEIVFRKGSHEPRINSTFSVMISFSVLVADLCSNQTYKNITSYFIQHVFKTNLKTHKKKTMEKLSLQTH